MWYIVAWVCGFAVAFASVMAHKARKEQMQKEKHQAYTRAESAKDAHYMRNFWNYDGGEQEEYQG